MAYKDPLSKKISLTSKARNIPTPSHSSGEEDITNMMLDARYLRQSSSLIQDALQKGFDVLQLANGNIIMTGTKTVIYQYTWDAEKSKLSKVKADKKAKKTGELEEEEIESEEA